MSESVYVKGAEWLGPCWMEGGYSCGHWPNDDPKADLRGKVIVTIGRENSVMTPTEARERAMLLLSHALEAEGVDWVAAKHLLEPWERIFRFMRPTARE